MTATYIMIAILWTLAGIGIAYTTETYCNPG